jgi:hypothetical protein
VFLCPDGAATRRIIVHAQNLIALLRLGGIGGKVGKQGFDMPRCVLRVIVQAWAADSIARRLAAPVVGDTKDLAEMLRPELGLNPKAVLFDWVRFLPAAAENWALLRMLGCGKIEGKLESYLGKERFVFKSLGIIPNIDAYLCPLCKSRRLRLPCFVQGQINLFLAVNEEGPVLVFSH